MKLQADNENHYLEVCLPEKNLTRKPLVEALLEVKWTLQDRDGGGPPYDPNFELLPGKFHDVLRGKYPEIENLPLTLVPSEMTAHQVRHRFRVSKNNWQDDGKQGWLSRMAQF